MTTAMTRYDNACRALAAAKAVDEVKEIHNQSEAMRAYAKQAKNKQLEIDAAEIRIRAERRIGELMKAQKEAGLMADGGDAMKARVAKKPEVAEAKITLAEAGIDKNLADRARKYAAVPDDEWEQELGDWRERVKEENNRVSTRLEKRGESEMRRTVHKECDIPDDAIVGSSFTCPHCGQKWPEGKPV
jgi:hypothetical protein